MYPISKAVVTHGLISVYHRPFYLTATVRYTGELHDIIPGNWRTCSKL